MKNETLESLAKEIAEKIAEEHASTSWEYLVPVIEKALISYGEEVTKKSFGEGFHKCLSSIAPAKARLSDAVWEPVYINDKGAFASRQITTAKLDVIEHNTEYRVEFYRINPRESE